MILKISFGLQTLCILKMMKLLENIPKIKYVQFTISNTQNSGLECLSNCLPHAKLYSLNPIVFTFEMQTT